MKISIYSFSSNNFRFTIWRYEKIIQLKKINENVKFIFYNGSQVIYDFCSRTKKEFRGAGDYAKMLLPEVVNNTKKIIIMDSGDIIAQKDLSEIFLI